MTGHTLLRTSPKGTPFLGRCPLCGSTDLPPEAARQPCPNPRGVTADEAFMTAIDGDEDDDR